MSDEDNFFNADPHRRRRKPASEEPPVAKENGQDHAGWQHLLALTPHGKPAANLRNATIALHHAPEWFGVFAFNEFTSRTEVAKRFPGGAEATVIPRELADVDVSAATYWLQGAAINVSSKVTAEAINAVAHAHHFHPVREYLGRLKWDQVPRIGMWLQDYLGATDTALHRAFGARWLIACVARIYRPGCQADAALILESRQGLGKSSAVRILAEPWFTDHLPDLSNKDAMQQLQGMWVIELAELDGLRRAETHRIKSFISARVDRFRPPFGMLPRDYPRQCCFAGTVNAGANGYLRDETGNRRFWTVACAEDWDNSQKADAGALASVRDQLWAEAVAHFQAGEPWHLDTVELESAQSDAAEERQEDDPRTPKIERFLVGRYRILMEEILGEQCLGIPPAQWNRRMETEIGFVLSVLKWRKRRERVNGKRQYCYEPIPK